MPEQEAVFEDGSSRMVAPEIQLGEVHDLSLRPQNLEDYVGQEEIRRNLEVFIAAAKKRNHALDHVLLSGPPGLGKTTLANIFAKEMGVQIRSTSGPVIERQGDLAAILTNLEPGTILFIDEQLLYSLHPCRQTFEPKPQVYVVHGYNDFKFYVYPVFWLCVIFLYDTLCFLSPIYLAHQS